MSNFDLIKFLTDKKLTSNSKLLEENIVPLKSIGIWIDTEKGTVYPMDKDGGWDKDNPMTLDQVDFYDMDDVSEEDYQVYLSVVKALQA